MLETVTVDSVDLIWAFIILFLCGAALGVVRTDRKWEKRILAADDRRARLALDEFERLQVIAACSQYGLELDYRIENAHTDGGRDLNRIQRQALLDGSKKLRELWGWPI